MFTTYIWQQNKFYRGKYLDYTMLEILIMIKRQIHNLRSNLLKLNFFKDVKLKVVV